jgi:hypothetical protein
MSRLECLRYIFIVKAESGFNFVNSNQIEGTFMKLKIFFIFSLLASVSGNAFAASSLSGDYRVVDSAQCLEQFNLQSGVPVKILASELGLELQANGGQTRDGSFAIPAGHSEIKECADDAKFCFGIIRRFFDASYAKDGLQFNALETLVDTSSPDSTPKFVGQISFALRGNSLQIDSTTSNQFEPAPKSTCLLTKIR